MTSPNSDLPGFTIDVSPPGGTVVAVSGEVDSYTGRHLQDRLFEVIGEDAKAITIDLAGVTFIDSSGLAVLVAVHHRLDELGGSLTLKGPSSATRKVLDITGLSHFLTVVD